jgi:GT2 family glycosyltransferase
MPRISAVVIARNEGENLRRTLGRLQATLPSESEIVVVDDGSDDGCADFLAANHSPVRLFRTSRAGISRARNYGARRTQGDILLFSDAHVDMDAGWWEPLVALLANPRVGAAAPVVANLRDPECKGYGLRLAGPDPDEEWLDEPPEAACPVPLLSGCCVWMRRDTFDAVGGFDEGMVCWGSEDTEISMRLWLLGYEVWLAPSVELRHLFRERHPYAVEWDWVVHNKLRLAHLHFGLERLNRVIEALRPHEAFASAMNMIDNSDAWHRRSALSWRRVRDDEWFFGTFGPCW